MSDIKPASLHFRLYAITDRTLCAPRMLSDAIHELLDVGVSGIQIREKDLSDGEFMKLARPIRKLCHTYAAQLFINSRIEIAMDVRADGVHLPGDAASVGEVIERTDGRLVIGCSVHTLAEAKRREIEGAHFLTYSPIYLTASKPGYGPAVGLDNLHKVAGGVNIPVFALGGITPERVLACIDAGAYGVAVMSGVMSSGGAQRAKAYLHQLAGVETSER